MRHSGRSRGGLWAALLVVVGAWAVPAWAEDAAPTRPLCVHIVRGLWSRMYRMQEAFGILGGAHVTESWHVSQWGFGTPGTWESPFRSRIEGFPGTSGELAQHALVVVCNINGSALTSASSADHLESYVRGGGTVLMLGGRYAFGKEYRGTPLEAMSPVRFPERVDLVHDAHGLVMQPSEASPNSVRGLSWNLAPRVYWYHDGWTFASHAETLVESDGHPLLVAGTYGKGRVLVFAGTVLGDPNEDDLPFWEWRDWPLLCAAVIARECGAAAAQSTGTMADEAETFAERLSDAAIGGAVDSEDAIGLARLCARRDHAALIVQAVASSSFDLVPETADWLVDRMLPWVDASFEDSARTLLDSDRPEAAAVGLRVLGATGAAGVLPLLLHARKTGNTQQARATAASSDGSMGMPGLDLLRDEVVRRTAVTALGDLGDRGALASLRWVAREAKSGAYTPGTNPMTLEPVHRDYQAARLAALRCGDTNAAAEVIDFLLENTYLIARGRTWETCIPDYLPAFRKQLPAARRWQGSLLRKLAFVPDSVLPALALRVARETDWRVTPLIFRVAAGRHLPDDVKATLARSPVPAVSALGQ